MTMPNGQVETTAQPVEFDELVRRARLLIAAGGRRVLGITGTPGSGKSTLCAALLDELGDDAVLVGMDGFHLANEELVRLQRRGRKGAPDTFDASGYVALLQRLRAQRDTAVYAPRFDRGIEESIAGAVPVHPGTALVITEGNYLLLENDGWAGVRAQLDEVWFLDVDPLERVERLNRRRRSYGHPADEAAIWVRDVDERNAVLVESSRERADLVAHLTTVLPDAGTTPVDPANQEVQV
jgi:pantothenate kinase